MSAFWLKLLLKERANVCSVIEGSSSGYGPSAAGAADGAVHARSSGYEQQVLVLCLSAAFHLGYDSLRIQAVLNQFPCHMFYEDRFYLEGTQ